METVLFWEKLEDSYRWSQKDKLRLSDLKGLQGFKIGHLNVHILTDEIEQVRLVLLRSGLDIFPISEPWLNKFIDTKLPLNP